MENNNNVAKQTSSHQNYGENYYAPPPMFQNNNSDLQSNSTQSSYYQVDMDAYKAQQASKDQAGMYQPIFPSSAQQGKPKRDYTIHYHHPETSEEKKPVDPLYQKIYGGNGGAGGNSGAGGNGGAGGNSYNFSGDKMCKGHCGQCYDCQMRRKVEEQKRREEEEYECMMNCIGQCCLAICLGCCEAALESR